MNYKPQILFLAFLICGIISIQINVLHRIDIVYTHLFYIPIILTALWFPKYAIYYAAALGLVHIGSNYIDTETIKFAAILRTFLFLVVAYLTSTKAKDILAWQEATTKLKDNEIHYRHLFMLNQLPMLIYEINSLKILDVNDEFLALYGYNRTEIPSLKLIDLFTDKEEKSKSDLDKQLKEHKYTGELHHIKKDGTQIIIEVRSHYFPYKGTDARIAVINDITKRKMADIILRENERKLREAQELAHLGFWTWDIKTGKVEWSSEVYKIFGIDQKIFSPQIDSILQLSPWPEDHKRDKELIEKAIQTHKPGNYEQRFLRPDKSIGYYYSTFQGNFNKKDELISIFGTVLDITERKLAEREIKKANRVYAVLSNMNHAIVHLKNTETLFKEACRIAVEDGKFRMAWVGMVDKQTNKVLPVASAGMVDNYLDDISIDLNDEQLSKGPTGQAIKTGIHFITNDITNNPIMVRWRANALRLGYKSSAAFPIIVFGKTIGALMIYAEEQNFFTEAEVKLLDNMVMDTSFAIEFIENEVERKRNEDNVNKLNAELEQRVILRTTQLEEANKELEAFSYSVSHDLRAPLRHANGYAELLIKKFKTDLPEKAQHYLNTIIESVHQMGTLIDELLQFSRTGRSELKKSVSDMNLILKEVIQTIEKEILSRSIEWKIVQLPTVECDSSMIKLVWMNLLSNAVKFTRKQEKVKIEIGFFEENHEYIFFVRDNGVGFDMQYSQKLFGVFQRLHSIEEFEGTGIGLANVRRIVLKHDGRTWAEGELNKGATFYFSLPKNSEGKL